jgi:hypothetical protein
LGRDPLGEQAKRSFNDAVEAGQAIEHFVGSQATAHLDQLQNAEKLLRELARHLLVHGLVYQTMIFDN